MQEIASIVKDSDVSPFEIIHSGLVEKILAYLTTTDIRQRDLRLRRFLHVFLNCPVSKHQCNSFQALPHTWQIYQDRVTLKYVWTFISFALVVLYVNLFVEQVYNIMLCPGAQLRTRVQLWKDDYVCVKLYSSLHFTCWRVYILMLADCTVPVYRFAFIETILRTAAIMQGGKAFCQQD